MIDNFILNDMGNVIQLGETENEEGLKCNDTSYSELPPDMRFNDGHLVTIITYSILMVISAIGNISVLTIIKKRKSKSRIQNLVMHLSIADLFVTFLMMPFEIGWSITVTWDAGDAMCRIMAFFRMFGLYLSSFIIICISIDRYYAVMRPLQILDIHRRGKILLMLAWIGSVLCSMPQMLIFHLETHPNHSCYTQCITFNIFPSYMHEISYSLFSMLVMYWFPLIVIFYTYTSIFMEICRRSKERSEDRIRRSSSGFLSRARVRTLKMTITIIAVFIICWSPYYVMSVWYWIDRATARNVDPRIQRALFFFACTNSSMNPIIYGIFNIRQRNKLQRSTPRKAQRCLRQTFELSRRRLDEISAFDSSRPEVPANENLYFRSRRRCVQPPSRPGSRHCPYRSNFLIDNEHTECDVRSNRCI